MSNLREERIMILEMVREGKISTEDATKLLNSIGAGSGTKEVDQEEIEEKFNRFYNSVDSFAKDLKDRFGKVYKDAEPKVKDVTKKAMVKTASLMEELSEKISESVSKLEETAEELREEADELLDEEDEL